MEPADPADSQHVADNLAALLDDLYAAWNPDDLTTRKAITACVLRAHSMEVMQNDPGRWHWQQLADRLALEVAGDVGWWNDELERFQP